MSNINMIWKEHGFVDKFLRRATILPELPNVE
jgi:hypothetical protein